MFLKLFTTCICVLSLALHYSKNETSDQCVLSLLRKDNSMPLAEMRGACSTCVLKFNRLPGWRAAGVSYVSFHPNLNWSMSDKLFFYDLIRGLLNAHKFFFTTQMDMQKFMSGGNKSNWEHLMSPALDWRCVVTTSFPPLFFLLKIVKKKGKRHAWLCWKGNKIQLQAPVKLINKHVITCDLSVASYLPYRHKNGITYIQKHINTHSI